MRKGIHLVFGLIYMLASSIFFHAYSMHIVIPHGGACECPMSMDDMNHSSSDVADNGCFEKCLGAYDEFAIPTIEEEITQVQKTLYDGTTLLSPREVQSTVHTTPYHQLIDGGGGIYQFPSTFIKITKRQE